MQDLTHSLNLLAKHQHAAKRAERSLQKDYTHDNHDRHYQTTKRVEAQAQNIRARITTNPRLP